MLDDLKDGLGWLSLSGGGRVQKTASVVKWMLNSVSKLGSSSSWICLSSSVKLLLKRKKFVRGRTRVPRWVKKMLESRRWKMEQKALQVKWKGSLGNDQERREAPTTTPSHRLQSNAL